MNKVNWGIIGPGSIARAFAHSIKNTTSASLISVFGRNEDKSLSFANEFNINSENDLAKFLANPSLDAVYIATPHSDHFSYAFEAIRNNKHVLCEKPLTMNPFETMALLDFASSSGKFFMEGYMYRSHPQTKNILDALDLFKGIGQPIFIESNFGFRADVAPQHRLRNPDLGGGAILDIGCYPLSMSQLIAGKLLDKSFAEPISIDVTGRLDSTGVDAYSAADIKFSDTVTAKIACAIDEELDRTLRIFSDNTSITISDPWHCGQFNNGNSNIVINHNDSEKTIEVNDSVGLFTREIDHATKCISEGFIESTFVTHRETYAISFWLENWRNALDIKCPKSKIKNSPIKSYSLTKYPLTNLAECSLPNLTKLGSRLAFGCDNQVSELHAFTMFDHFYRNGGRIFDTAYIYNHGNGDKYLGSWIKNSGLESSAIVLGKGAHTPQCEPKFIRPQIIESLERLQLNSMDIFCLHRDNLDIPIDEFVSALNDVVDEGLVNLIGASNWTLSRFAAARDYAAESNMTPFTVISNNFSLAAMVDPVWPGCVGMDSEFLNYVNNEGLILFPWSSQARGFFIPKKSSVLDHFSNPTMEEEKRVWHSEDNILRRDRCFKIAKNKGIEPIEVALAYVLSTSPNIIPLIGPRNVFETNSSIKASKIILSQDELEFLEGN